MIKLENIISTLSFIQHAYHNAYKYKLQKDCKVINIFTKTIFNII